MTTLFVQSRWNPPGLIPLNLEECSRDTLRERIDLIERVAKQRPLTDFEVDELLAIQDLLAGKRAKRPRNWKPSAREAAEIEAELLG